MDKNLLNGKRILITGASGYLGSKLIHSLQETGAIIYLLGSPNGVPRSDFEFCIDLKDKDAVQKVVQTVQPQLVYHLAASLDRNRTFDNYAQIVANNVDSTLNLLEALRTVDCENFIFTSSSEVYGNQSYPFVETMTLSPASPYSLSKVYAEHLIRTYSSLYGTKYSILRLFNFYGEGMSEQFFIPQIIASLGRNEDFAMTKGEQFRDFLYVEDILQGLILAGIHPNAIGETFNVCSGEGTSLKQLAEEIATQSVGSTGEIKLGAIPYRDNEIWEMIGCNQKIKDLLGFAPAYSITEGITQCIKNRTS